MRRIGHRELRTHSVQILTDVKNGQVIEVTDHDEVVAVLIPPAGSPYERLVAAGQVQQAEPTVAGGFGGLRVSRSERDPVEILAEMRGE